MRRGAEAGDEHLWGGLPVAGRPDRFPAAQAAAQHASQAPRPGIGTHATAPGAQAHPDVAPAAPAQTHRDASWCGEQKKTQQDGGWTEEQSSRKQPLRGPGEARLPEQVTVATVSLRSGGRRVPLQVNRELALLGQL